MVGTSEPLSLDGQEIYRALPDADATDATAFLAGGLEPLAARHRYLAIIAVLWLVIALGVARADLLPAPAQGSAPGGGAGAGRHRRPARPRRREPHADRRRR